MPMPILAPTATTRGVPRQLVSPSGAGDALARVDLVESAEPEAGSELVGDRDQVVPHHRIRPERLRHRQRLVGELGLRGESSTDTRPSASSRSAIVVSSAARPPPGTSNLMAGPLIA